MPATGSPSRLRDGVAPSSAGMTIFGLLRLLTARPEHRHWVSKAGAGASMTYVKGRNRGEFRHPKHDPEKPALGLDPKVDTGFRKRSCSSNKLTRNGLRHFALADADNGHPPGVYMGFRTRNEKGP
jgi:hypothetical protein